MTFDPPSLPPDPYLKAQQRQSNLDQLGALQDKLRTDTSTLMSNAGALSSLGLGPSGIFGAGGGGKSKSPKVGF